MESAKRRSHEGPKRHIMAFIVSIIFTALAFAAVAYSGSTRFVGPFIVVLAIIQALFQLYIWMHLDQKGHEFPSIGLAFGAVVAFSAVITFIYWMGGW